VSSLDAHLRGLKTQGRKAFVPYLMAGAVPDWTRHVEAAALGGADAIEIGIPFSDPMMDGVVIQEAALRALDRGTTLESICQELEDLDVGVPLIAMTYYNIFLHYGLARSAGRLQSTGVSGAIVPDLPFEEADEWSAACSANDVATIYLVAPSTPSNRLHTLASLSQGFVYASARMAVTGAASDDGDAARVVSDLRGATDTPVYVGIGITTPDQARRATEVSDGVIVGSALVQLVLDDASFDDVEKFVQRFRASID
jgi:tryptophan synthase alpha chain